MIGKPAILTANQKMMLKFSYLKMLSDTGTTIVETTMMETIPYFLLMLWDILLSSGLLSSYVSSKESRVHHM